VHGLVRRLGLAFATLLLAPVVAGAGETIASVVANGAHLSGQTVTVTGRVADPKATLGNESTFTVTDGDLRLAIFGHGRAPTTGQALVVTGTVGFKPEDEEFTWPPILVNATWTPAP